jgi:gliding motility-associated-like protein
VNGCTSPEASSDLVVNEVIAGFTSSVSVGEIPLDVDFTNTSTGATSYVWDFGDGNTSTDANPTNTFETIGEFVVTLTVTDGNCTDEMTMTITTSGLSVLTVPNVFSPNGDGMNDLFYVTAENLVSFSGTILNRWGEVVFSMQDETARWDGYTTAGIVVPDGTYFYIIEAEGADGETFEFTGHLMLIRD